MIKLGNCLFTRLWQSRPKLSRGTALLCPYDRCGSNTARLRIFRFDFRNVETRRQVLQRGEPPSGFTSCQGAGNPPTALVHRNALAQISRLYKDFGLVDFLNRAVLDVVQIRENCCKASGLVGDRFSTSCEK